MVHTPNTPNRPKGDIGELTPDMIEHITGEPDIEHITVPTGSVESDDSLGTLIELSTGQPLTGGPLNIIGVDI